MKQINFYGSFSKSSLILLINDDYYDEQKCKVNSVAL